MQTQGSCSTSPVPCNGAPNNISTSLSGVPISESLPGVGPVNNPNDKKYVESNQADLREPEETEVKLELMGLSDDILKKFWIQTEV